MPFLTPLRIESVRGRGVGEKRYVLIEPLFYELPHPRARSGLSCAAVTVPAGYRTDLASVPRALAALFPSDDDYRDAAVVHDYICTHLRQLFTPSGAADVMLDAMVELGVARWKRTLMHAGVRAYWWMKGRGDAWR